MAHQEGLRIIGGSLLRIEFSPEIHTGLKALEATVMSQHDLNGELIVIMWLRQFFKKSCRLVFNKEVNTWKLLIPAGKAVSEILVTSVVVLEEGVTEQDDFKMSL